MPILRVIDIETTGLAPPAEIIEFGRLDVTWSGVAWIIERPMSALYRPLNGIPPETMAVHHITEADFAPNTPVCSPPLLQSAVWDGTRPDVLVAHNCAFERSFISDAVTAALPWIWIITGPVFTSGTPRQWLGQKELKEMAVAIPDAMFKVGRSTETR